MTAAFQGAATFIDNPRHTLLAASLALHAAAVGRGQDSNHNLRVLGGFWQAHDEAMAYPSRKSLDPLPRFTASSGTRQTSDQRADLLAFVAAEYASGRSLRELAELTDRTQTAVRRALDQAGVARRPSGAPRVDRKTR